MPVKPSPSSNRLAGSPPGTSPQGQPGSPSGGYLPNLGTPSYWSPGGGGGGGPTNAGTSGSGASYANSVHNRPSRFVAMMDLDESLRALYFAPVPMAVLDQNRQVRMLNRPAELIMGVNATACTGQRFERWIAASSKQQYNMSLNEAAQNAGASNWTGPVLTRVTLLVNEEARAIDVDLSVSPWFATAPMFDSDSEPVMTPRDTPQPPTPLSPHARPEPVSTPSSSSGSGSTSASRPAAPLIHEAMFTVSLVPVRSSERRMSPADAHKSKADMLREAVLHTMDTAVMALSSDGTALVRNRACDMVLRDFTRAEPSAAKHPPTVPEEGHLPQQDQMDIDLSWLTTKMHCYDEDFKDTFPESKYPIYRSAVLGQRTDPVNVGCINPDTGERKIFRVAGKPMRDAGGFGEHIGGLITIVDITAERRERHKDAVALGDAYFKQTCDAMPQLVWVTTPSGYHEWYSKSWYEYTGSSEKESEGVGWQGLFHPDDMPESSRRWGHSLRTGELYETAYRCRRHDGAWRWMLGRAQPLRDPDTGEILKWFGTCTDIHDQVEALAASRQAQTQLESVINQAAMTLWAVDREGIVTVAEGPGLKQLKLMAPGTPAGSEKEMSLNTGLIRMDGESSESGAQYPSNSNSNSNSNSRRHYSMVGRSIYSVWGSPDIRNAIQSALEGESVTEEMEVDGRWFRTTYNPLRAAKPEGLAMTALAETSGDGEIIGVVGASMDITERKRAQQRIEESLLEKSRALAAEGAAREASRLKSEFLANMSHEIRTPIAGVIGLSELLLDEKLTPQQRDFAETIQRSAEGLLTVINDVLDFSKVEIGKLDVEKAPFNLEVVLRDQKRMLSFATQKKGLEFRDSVDLKYSGLLLGDAGRLRQVITNLLTNAIKFTSQGFISLDVAQIEETETRVTVRFDVRDSGCGISPETLSRLFQPFSQADPSTARRFGGTGLGLSISKNLVELMHGKIGLDSVVGEGSHAWFLIPFDKAAKKAIQVLQEAAKVPPSPAVPGMPGTEERNPLSRPRKDIWILIAEDNLVNAQIASKNLKRMGFSCRTAENGLLALEELAKRPYDAVLMDCQMPECDGYEATRRMRRSKNPEIRILPVIALTASAIKGDRERALDAGMNDYLAKPVKRPALEATICRWLYDQDARQSLSKWCEMPTTPWEGGAPSEAGSMPTPATMPPSVPADGLMSQRMEYPFPAIAKQTPISGLSQLALSSKSSSGVSPDRELPADAASVAGDGVSPGTAVAGVSGLTTIAGVTSFSPRNMDNIGAAAVLMAARRASDETGESIIRPPMSPRSYSHQAASINSLIASAQGLDTPAGRSPGGSALGPARVTQDAQSPSLPRRSSRGQAGMGRDFEGEIHRQLDGEPHLDEAMRSSSDERLPSTDEGDNVDANAAGTTTTLGVDQDEEMQS